MNKNLVANTTEATATTANKRLQKILEKRTAEAQQKATEAQQKQKAEAEAEAHKQVLIAEAQKKAEAEKKATAEKNARRSKAVEQKQKEAQKQKATADKKKAQQKKAEADKKQKQTLTSVQDVQDALKRVKFDNRFRVVAKESSLHDNNVKIHLINADKTLSSQACFVIGIFRKDFRFSSNDKFASCAFLKNEKVNSRHRYEVTVKREDIDTCLKQACECYTKLYCSDKKQTTATADKKQKEA